MKKIFWIGTIGLLLFEAANVYFIMPMPGSQRMNSLDLAYFFYQWRWLFRIVFGVCIIAGLLKAEWKRRWLLFFPLAVLGAVIYMTNFVMAADHMFYQPQKYLLSDAKHNKIDTTRLVLGVAVNNEAKAYPIQLIGYHHQVQDTIGGKPILVTYCTVCRTGRVYEPVINGKQETFRLVGMDHFNAMLEDATTKSWWRQVTGEAVTGKLKGQKLPEVLSTQSTLSEWLKLYPHSLIMQPDPTFTASYDTAFKYESGKSKSKLTGTDSLSWKDKSWVIGIKENGKAKAYDWNRLKEERIIRDVIGTETILIVLAADNKSYFAYRLPSNDNIVTFMNDVIIINNARYSLNGQGIDNPLTLNRINASQEFWHSWKTFNPGTLVY